MEIHAEPYSGFTRVPFASVASSIASTASAFSLSAWNRRF